MWVWIPNPQWRNFFHIICIYWYETACVETQTHAVSKASFWSWILISKSEVSPNWTPFFYCFVIKQNKNETGHKLEHHICVFHIWLVLPHVFCPPPDMQVYQEHAPKVRGSAQDSKSAVMHQAPKVKRDRQGPEINSSQSIMRLLSDPSTPRWIKTNGFCLCQLCHLALITPIIPFPVQVSFATARKTAERKEPNCNWGRLLLSDRVFSYSSGRNPTGKQKEWRVVNPRWQSCPLSSRSLSKTNSSRPVSLLCLNGHFHAGDTSNPRDITMDLTAASRNHKITVVTIKAPINNGFDFSIHCHITPDSMRSTRSELSHVKWISHVTLNRTFSSAVMPPWQTMRGEEKYGNLGRFRHLFAKFLCLCSI